MFSQRIARKAKILIVLIACVVAISVAAFRVSAPVLCTYITTSRGILSTAAIDNVPNTSGNIDGTGCDIGDYVDMNLAISGFVVHDANRYGIFVDSELGSITVSITNTVVHDIGAHSGTVFNPNGVQTGIGIIYDSGASGPVARGSITSSTVYAYQKGGIVINHNSNVTTTDNTVTGLGPVPFIAQNGIEYARDAVGIIRGNVVSNNFYTGKTGVLADGSPCGGMFPACPPGRQYVSTGILLVLIDPNNIQRGQNDVSQGNQHNYAVITDSPTD